MASPSLGEQVPQTQANQHVGTVERDAAIESHNMSISLPNDKHHTALDLVNIKNCVQTPDARPNGGGNGQWVHFANTTDDDIVEAIAYHGNRPKYSGTASTDKLARSDLEGQENLATRENIFYCGKQDDGALADGGNGHWLKYVGYKEWVNDFCKNYNTQILHQGERFTDDYDVKLVTQKHPTGKDRAKDGDKYHVKCKDIMPLVHFDRSSSAKYETVIISNLHGGEYRIDLAACARHFLQIAEKSSSCCGQASDDTQRGWANAEMGIQYGAELWAGWTDKSPVPSNDLVAIVSSNGTVPEEDSNSTAGNASTSANSPGRKHSGVDIQSLRTPQVSRHYSHVTRDGEIETNSVGVSDSSPARPGVEDSSTSRKEIFERGDLQSRGDERMTCGPRIHYVPIDQYNQKAAWFCGTFDKEVLTRNRIAYKYDVTLTNQKHPDRPGSAGTTYRESILCFVLT